MRVLWLAVTLICSFYLSRGQAQVTLTPAGEVEVCIVKPYDSYYTRQQKLLTLTCTAHNALWTTSGFGEGLDDLTRVPAVRLASSSTRVTTTDTSILTNSSSITLSNFTYDDHGARVSCDGRLPTDQQSVTLAVGPPDCTGSLTASRVAADSAVISWVIHTCLGNVQDITGYYLYWYPLEEILYSSDAKYIFINSSNNNQYKITGLSPSTKYYISNRLAVTSSYCLNRPLREHTALVEAASGTPADVTVYSLAAVSVVLFLLLLLLTTVIVIVCKKSKSITAVAIRKNNDISGGQCSGLELSGQQEPAYTDMKPKIDGIQVDENPAYQSMEIAMHA